MNNIDINLKTKNLAFQVAKGIDAEAFIRSESNIQNKDHNQVLRERFYEVLGVESWKDRNVSQRLMSRSSAIFELISEILVEQIPDLFKNNPLLEKFTEFRDINYGDKNAFTVYDNSLLTVSTFSGGHLDTDRQKFRGKSTVTIDTEWLYLHVYSEFWDFLTNKITFETLLGKVRQSIMYDLQQRISANFSTAPNILPSEFKVSGTFDEDIAIRIAETVMAATGSQSVLFAGTKLALNKLRNGITDPWVSSHMIDTVNKTGMIQDWNGYELLTLPSVLKSGTYTLDDNQNKLYILPSNIYDNKIIKVVNEGTPIVRSTANNTSNQDMTLDYQIQYKLGTGIIMNSHFGYWDLV